MQEAQTLALGHSPSCTMCACSGPPVSWSSHFPQLPVTPDILVHLRLLLLSPTPIICSGLLVAWGLPCSCILLSSLDHLSGLMTHLCFHRVMFWWIVIPTWLSWLYSFVIARQTSFGTRVSICRSYWFPQLSCGSCAVLHVD